MLVLGETSLENSENKYKRRYPEVKMLSGPAAITGQLPGRSSYNNSVDVDAYGEKNENCCVVKIC